MESYFYQFCLLYWVKLHTTTTIGATLVKVVLLNICTFKLKIFEQIYTNTNSLNIYYQIAFFANPPLTVSDIIE